MGNFMGNSSTDSLLEIDNRVYASSSLFCSPLKVVRNPMRVKQANKTLISDYLLLQTTRGSPYYIMRKLLDLSLDTYLVLPFAFYTTYHLQRLLS